MAKEENWELKGQLLILCSNALLFFNTQPLDENEYRGTGQDDADKILETSNE